MRSGIGEAEKIAILVEDWYRPMAPCNHASLVALIAPAHVWFGLPTILAALAGDRPSKCAALHHPFPLAGLLAAIFILPEGYGFEHGSSAHQTGASPAPSGP